MKLIYKNKKYKNLKAISKAMGMSHGTLYRRINEQGLSLEDAIETTTEPKTYYYNNIKYTVKELANIAGLSPQLINNRIRSGMCIKDAVESKRHVPRYAGTKYNGKVYENLEELANDYDINISTLNSRLCKGMSLDEAITYNEYDTEFAFIYKGVDYKHIKDLSVNLGFKYTRFLRYIRETGSVEAGVVKYRKLEDDKEIVVWGNTFTTYGEIEKYYGLAQTELKNRIDGDRSSHAIEALVADCLNSGVYFNDKHYDSITALASDYGMLGSNVFARLRLSWDLETALTTPINGKKGSVISYDGVDYISMNELCRVFKINKDYVNTLSKERVSWMNAFELIIDFLKENQLFDTKGKPELLTATYAVIYNDVWFKHHNQFTKACGMDHMKFVRFKNRHRNIGHVETMKLMKDETVMRYKYENNYYTKFDLKQKLGIVTFDRLIATGCLKPEDVPKHPECTFVETGLCFSYKHEFDTIRKER